MCDYFSERLCPIAEKGTFEFDLGNYMIPYWRIHGKWKTTVIISAASTRPSTHSFDVSSQPGSMGRTIHNSGSAISTPVVGKIADRYGQKKVISCRNSSVGYRSTIVALSPDFGLSLESSLYLQKLDGGRGNFHYRKFRYIGKQFKRKNKEKPLEH